MSDIDIARSATYEHIKSVAKKIDVPEDSILEYGPYKGKVSYQYLQSLNDRADGKVVLVTSINPTPAGEGKTTTTVGLGDALNRVGKKAAICLREPSLGPVFGVKGGAAGGGHAQVVPMEDINLHFTGDFHAITSAHNLLSAMIDNHIHHGNELRFDMRRVAWQRVIDMNDRVLRNVTIGLGGPANGFLREASFDITVASEVMAIFCLATDLDDLTRRLGKIVVGYTREKRPITADMLEAPGPMSVLLRDALMPNIVQTLENNPAFIHGGPFANIAHGCNSVMATKASMKLADYTVTEAGFGADLGAEKFFDIKCRKSGIKPNAAVVVATVRALKMHGGVAKDHLGEENVEAVKQGSSNLGRHVQNVKKYGLPLVVAINRFPKDTDAELEAIKAYAQNELGVKAVICTHFGDGGAGAQELANEVIGLVESWHDQFATLYPENTGLWEKTRTIAREIYGADDITADQKIRDRFKELEQEGYGHFPICMAKTANSFSTDPGLKGAPSNFDVPIREVRISAGAEFVVVICGAVMTMPGLPSRPAANEMYVDNNGNIQNIS